jgi:hypothetical protein
MDSEKLPWNTSNEKAKELTAAIFGSPDEVKAARLSRGLIKGAEPTGSQPPPALHSGKIFSQVKIDFL